MLQSLQSRGGKFNIPTNAHLNMMFRFLFNVFIHVCIDIICIQQRYRPILYIYICVSWKTFLHVPSDFYLFCLNGYWSSTFHTYNHGGQSYRLVTQHNSSCLVNIPQPVYGNRLNNFTVLHQRSAIFLLVFPVSIFCGLKSPSTTVSLATIKETLFHKNTFFE